MTAALAHLGENSPFHTINPEYESLYCDPEDSLYSDTNFFYKSEEKMNPDEYFTEGGKVYHNLDGALRPISPGSLSQSLPKFETAFSRNRCDSELSISRDSGIQSPTHVTSLSPTAMTQHSRAYDKPTWTDKHPKSWSSEEVVNWIYSMAALHNIDNTVRGEAFRTVTGKDLYNMTADDFRKLSDEHFQVFYRGFFQLRNRSQFNEPETEINRPLSPMLSQTSEHFQLKGFESPTLDGEVPDLSIMMDCPETPSMSVAVIGTRQYEFNPNDNFTDINHPNSGAHHLAARPRRPETESDDLGYSSGESENAHARMVPNLESFNRESPTLQMTETNMHIDGADEEEEQQQPLEKPKKVPGKRGRKLGQTTRGNHLWEFMRDLLKDPRYNPSLVEWKDDKLGVFRVVQSSEVASMWGQKKKNSSMNYEKLSRAMRFCRDKGYFDNVPKSGKYPKKLCFRFGPRAFGWQPTETTTQQQHP